MVYFRTLADFRRVQALPVGRHVAVVGGGFIGSELAASLATAGYRVTLAFPEDGIGARVFPRDLSLELNRVYAEREVDVRAGETITGLERDGGGFVLHTARGALRADLVVAGLGVRPNDELAAAAGLAVDDGIVVDETLRTGDPDVFAAGDVARFPSPVLEGTVRIEHDDNASRMGFEAGRAMAGASVAYRHLPFFYSDLFELGYEAVGRIDARLQVFAEWKTPFARGVLYYLEDERVRGVLTFGAFGKMDAARALLADAGPHSEESLRGRIAI